MMCLNLEAFAVSLAEELINSTELNTVALRVYHALAELAQDDEEEGIQNCFRKKTKNIYKKWGY